MFSPEKDKGEIRESRINANAGAGRAGMLPALNALNLEKAVEPQIDANERRFRRCLGCRNRRNGRGHGATRSYRATRKNWRSLARSTANEKRLLTGVKSGQEKHTVELQRSMARVGVGERNDSVRRHDTGIQCRPRDQIVGALDFVAGTRWRCD